jgi:hypothetical protein
LLLGALPGEQFVLLAGQQVRLRPHLPFAALVHRDRSGHGPQSASAK